MLTVGFVAALSVFVSFVRSRRHAQLVTERAVAEAAQLAVVPPLPPRVGSVRCAGRIGPRSAGRWSEATSSTYGKGRSGYGP
ncbi:hypothetical protein SALBM311S_10492 [Streptomyces alboniger]